MKRNIYFAMGAIVIALSAWGIYLGYSYFYPKQYVKNPNGEYINVNAPEADTFPITKNTRFIIEYYDPDEGRILSENVSSIPDLLGCSKKQTLKYLSDYVQHSSVAEQEQGLCNYEMSSYNGQVIHLRKTFRKKVNTSYIAKSFNGIVVIMNSDGKTVFEYTNINIGSLPEDIREQLMDGLSIENEEELYNFMENYSS